MRFQLPEESFRRQNQSQPLEPPTSQRLTESNTCSLTCANPWPLPYQNILPKPQTGAGSSNSQAVLPAENKKPIPLQPFRPTAKARRPVGSLWTPTPNQKAPLPKHQTK